VFDCHRHRIDGLVIANWMTKRLSTTRLGSRALPQPTARWSWTQCEERHRKGSCRPLRSEFTVPLDEDVVWLAVKQLEQFHLIEPRGKSPRVSRRKLMLKYAPAALAPAGESVD